MKNIIFTLLFVLGTISSVHAQSMEKVPPIISAPMVIYDDAGNVVEDGEYEILVTVKDRFENSVYQEEHITRVSQGVAYITLGSGYAVDTNYTAPAGGMNHEMFITDGDLKVEVLVLGHETPQIINAFGSQPYSFVSDYALGVANNSITSNKIRDGGVKAEDLDPQLLQALLASAEDGERPAVNFTPVTELDASSILLSDQIGLNNAGGGNVQDALRGMDKAIDNLREVHIKQGLEGLDQIVGNVQNILNQEIEARGEALQEVQNDLQQQINETTNNLEGQIANETNLRELADNNITNNVNNLSQNIQNETNLREQADNNLQNTLNNLNANLVQERNLRIAGDNNLTDRVNIVSQNLATETINRNQDVNEIRNLIENLDFSQVDGDIEINQLPDEVVLANNPDPNVTDLSDILARLDALDQLLREVKGTADDAVDNLPFAYGEVMLVGDNDGGMEDINRNTIVGITPLVFLRDDDDPPLGQGLTMRIHFTEPQPDTNYNVMFMPVVADNGEKPRIINLVSKQVDSFELRMYEFNGGGLQSVYDRFEFEVRRIN